MLKQANFREILNAKRDKTMNNSIPAHVAHDQHFLSSSSASTESQ